MQQLPNKLGKKEIFFKKKREIFKNKKKNKKTQLPINKTVNKAEFILKLGVGIVNINKLINKPTIKTKLFLEKKS